MGKKYKERTAVEERKIFSWPEKYEMLLKSNSKCAHCGAGITPDTFTAEHIIPLSKGGSNDMGNMVALCHSCNEEKSDFIYEPQSYYKYLKKDILKKNQADYEKYITNVNWLSLNNMYPNDEFDCRYRLIMKDRNGNPKFTHASIKIHKASAHTYQDEDQKVLKLMLGDEAMPAAPSSDRKKLFDFISRYNQENGVDCQDDELWDTLNEYFDKGCIYYAGSIDDIKLAIPVRIENRYVKKLEREHYSIVFGNPMYLNEGPTSADLSMSIVKCILAEILKLASKCGVGSSLVCIETMAKNYWYRTMTALVTGEIGPSGWGIFVDANDVRQQMLKDYGGEIPKGQFQGTYYVKETNGKRYDFIDGLGGIAGTTVDNENLVRWDRFVQKFCGSENIHYHSGNWDKGLLPDDEE